MTVENNEMESFANFFEKMGVVFEIYHEGFRSVPDCKWSISVSQAWFCFDDEKKYMGVMSDETLCFEPQIEKEVEEDAEGDFGGT